MEDSIDSLPPRPLKVHELRSIEQSLEFTAPMVVLPRLEGSDIYAASLINSNHVTGIVFEDEVESWCVMDRRERPVSPQVFEDQYRVWAEDYPDLICLCDV